MADLKLYMLLLGCRPPGRHTEQHDIFFGIGNSLYDLIPDIKRFWPEVKGNIHIDAWREVTNVDGYNISVVPKGTLTSNENGNSLFFINLGGYRENYLEEYHYKVLAVAKNMDQAKAAAKDTAFYKHMGVKGGPSHVDDKYGVDTDDLYEVKDILPAAVKEKYAIQITASESRPEDELYIAYLPLYKISKA